MSRFDRKYLSLQFRLAVHQKSGTEYQTFFESIMGKVYTGFQKVRPYGKEGDKGNDGYRPAEGIYYQVYAPLDPQEKEGDAADKFKVDFGKLKAGWDKISTIKELNFVYNDKGSGLTIKLEETRAELRDANPSIEFRIFTPKQLEEVFLSLTPDQIASLGFDLDSRNALQSAREQLGMLDVDLDRDSGQFVLRVLDTIRDIVSSASDEGLLLEFELLETRALQKIEQVIAARDRLEGLAKRYPDDPRAYLYLSEIAINDENFDRNSELLARAEAISPNFWLLRLQKLVRHIRLDSPADPMDVDEANFPHEPRIRSNFYRLAGALLSQGGDRVKAEAFIERAVHLNPDKFANHDAKIAFRIRTLMSYPDVARRRSLVGQILELAEDVERQFDAWGGLAPRNQAVLNLRRLYAYIANENYDRLEAVTTETFELLLVCHFDYLVEGMMAEVLHHTELERDDLTRLLAYVKRAEKRIGEVLTKALISQFVYKKTLLTEAKTFFGEIGRTDALSFIEAIEENNYAAVIDFIGDDLRFGVDIALSPDAAPDLRGMVIDSLPEDGVRKQKLLLALHHDQGDLDKAFEIVQQLDLSSLSYVESVRILRVVRHKKAWDAVAVLVEKTLRQKTDPKTVLHMKLELFTANLNLDRFTEVIRIGREILSSAELELLDDRNIEILVAQTAYAYLKRGEPGVVDFIRANEHLLQTFEAKVGVQAEVFVKHGDGEKALRSVVEGVKLLRHPSPEEYGALFLIFSSIGNLLPEFELTSSEEVTPDSFVKLKDQERWYFVGEGAPLDATKVTPGDDKYNAFIGRRLGDKVPFPRGYRMDTPEHVIETILPTEKYILWQSLHHAEKLTVEERWNAMEMIPVPTTGDSIDLTYLIAKLKDQAERGGKFFTLYCEQNIPLAFLALNEGGLANAIGRITSEQKGFVKALTGSPDELEEQKRVANTLLAGEPFYIDGTAALFLTESGILSKILESIPSFRVPQSVITLLFEVRAKFEDSPGATGHMAYVNGQARFTENDPEQLKQIREKFTAAIDALEAKPQNISVISAASKSGAFVEQRIAPSLSDACILAQKEGVAVLTDDFLYLQANEHETKKQAPPYVSTLTLMRALYEARKVGLDEFLSYFAYLSSYRVRFLPITTDDLELAVYGDQTVKVIQPEQLRKFNFRLTLSDEYGVTPRAAFQVVGSFLFRILLDDSLSAHMATRTFAEIVSTFPTKLNRKSFGRTLLVGTVKALNSQWRQTVLSGTRTQEKIDAIAIFLSIYGSDELITPS